MTELYKDTNLNWYIKVRLTEEGRIIYKKHYAKYNCEAPKLNMDDEGYVRFQIHEFMNFFGERLFMGAALPCTMDCKIQVKDDWHDLRKDQNDLPPIIEDERKISNNVWIHVKNWGAEVGHYDYRKKAWIIRCRIVNLDVLGWTKIPEFEE